MACLDKRFFAVQLIHDDAPDLAPHWSERRTTATVLLFAGRRLLWRIVRKKVFRHYFAQGEHRVVPSDRTASRQVRIATGCRVGPFQEFQSLVRLLARSEEGGASIYLVGRGAEQLQRIEQNVRATFPHIRIVGRTVFHPSSVEPVTTAIRKASPQIVLSGVASDSFFRWVISVEQVLGPVLTIIAPRAVSRMAGRSTRPPVMDVLVAPLRLATVPILLIHRMALKRRLSRAPA